MNWKREIIKLTEMDAARASKTDSTFFPPVSEEQISDWEKKNEVQMPPEWASFYLQSNGLEARKGELVPLLPLEECSVLPRGCSLENPWIEIGKSPTHRYFLNLDRDSPTVWRVEEFGSEKEFFAANPANYLKAVFQGKS